MMKAATLSLLLLLPLTGPALAHSPPVPIFTCQVTDAYKKYHEYGPGWDGLFIFPLMDGNLDDCPKKMDITWGPLFDSALPPCDNPPVFAGHSPWCEEEKIANQFFFEYDGEIDYGGGGALLFVNSGDGMTHGTVACYGWPATGHHDTTIYAHDTLGFGPQFVVTADYSRPGLEQDPDCGDNLVEPCDPTPPPPSELDFPLNVIVDTINDVLYSVFGPGGEGCNGLDYRYRCASTAVGPSRCTVPFGAGADGALSVFLANDEERGRVPLAGHIWTG